MISLRHIERAYRKGTLNITALRDIDLEIADGEFLAIMGPSGSGKSTLLHLLGCLDRPTGGEYLLDGADVTTLNDAELSRIRNQKIGFVFQAFNLLPQHSVEENIAAPFLYAPSNTFTPSQTKQTVHALAEGVGLHQRLLHRPTELSGGEMQRVAIARALVMRPRMILADEPTGNLDSRTGEEIMALLAALHQQGHTLVVVTHEPRIAAFAQRVLHLKDGAIERIETRETPPLDAAEPYPGQPCSDMAVRGTVQPRLAFLASMLRVATQGVLLHKLRSLLSVLGIVFGVGAIIAMLAIGAGAKQELLEQIALLGTNTMTIKAAPQLEAPLERGAAQRSEGLTEGDADRLAQVSPFIQAIAPVRLLALPTQYQQQFTQADVIGTTTPYLQSGNLSLQSGRFLTDSDLAEASRVCVIGDDIRQALFAFRNPVGELIKIRNEWFQVVGVLSNKQFNLKKQTSLQVRNVNRQVIIPLSTAVMFIPPQERQRIQEIAIRVDDARNVDAAARLIRSALNRIHYGAQDYELVIPRELLRQSQQTQRVFNIVMGSIAGISLLVGGIGIMNIMLATVTERTREIGIRRAIGASQRMILLQFLIETLTLTLVGGVLGIALGVGGAWLITAFARWRTVIAFDTILIACGVSAVTGLIFGLYPASQAARKHPIAALRYE
ncbi:ABC transporter related [Candidatus Moduliflexus flocculans]|uniref:ABC transporter related n=1 Tax=Candidatus Moduliflexus flocculans TaxID=1499966 RepID=A0A081BNW6_9BACT|nr:ABC transporter related [Candidatus Moduliflexus flocculans]